LNLDSRRQLEVWWRLHPDAPVGIRCNIGDNVSPRRTHAGHFLGKASRLGLVPTEIEALRGEPRICGLHLYLGTDLTDLSYFEECYRQLARLATHFPGLRYLDFGGGFGVEGEGNGAFDFEAYGQLVTAVMEQANRTLGRRLRLILEPGRVLAADAGYFVCRVDDVKLRENRQLVGVNASVAQFPRPLFYPDEAFHPVALLTLEGQTREGVVPSAVYGCSTYSRDFLAAEVLLPEAQLGDLVVFGQAGAYCASAQTAFLGFPPVQEHCL
jgi:diaminopimelate decarboxylase